MMNPKLAWILKNLHLLLSVGIVVPVALIYGSTTWIAQQLNIEVTSVDLANLLKALMSLYLGLVLVWILGLLQASFWRIASVLNVLFMLSLALGRLLSMAVDGWPSGGLILAFVIEVLIGGYAIYQLLKSRKG